MGKSGGGEWRCSTDQCFRRERKTNWNHTHFSEVLNMFEMSSLFNTFGIHLRQKITIHKNQSSLIVNCLEIDLAALLTWVFSCLRVFFRVIFLKVFVLFL